MTTRRVLVAAVGNVLRGDGGFGPAVIRALKSTIGAPEGLHIADVGIGGINLARELMDGYDALVLVDAVDRAGAPGCSTFWSRRYRAWRRYRPWSAAS